MNTIKYIIGFISLTVSINAFAAARYISENVYTYMHSGPSQSYRIIGSVNAGTEINTLKYDDKTKYMQIKTQAGKVGWVKAADIQKELPAKMLLPQLKEQLQTAQTKLQNIADVNAKTLSEKEQSISDKDLLIEQLQTKQQSLEATILELQARNLELDLLQDTKDERVKMEWMINGGGVLLFGLLLGLILPFMPRRQKKRKDSW